MGERQSEIGLECRDWLVEHELRRPEAAAGRYSSKRAPALAAVLSVIPNKADG
jgi:hypothetical protein